ncbi:MAG: hypothetical protein HYV32_00740 [Candidatus Kerfeldbacteria bacterium]|nr:hypothetical protein [Candidatus Kerfeldbacteria bacterium]
MNNSLSSTLRDMGFETMSLHPGKVRTWKSNQTVTSVWLEGPEEHEWYHKCGDHRDLVIPLLDQSRGGEELSMLEVVTYHPDRSETVLFRQEEN